MVVRIILAIAANGTPAAAVILNDAALPRHGRLLASGRSHVYTAPGPVVAADRLETGGCGRSAVLGFCLRDDGAGGTGDLEAGIEAASELTAAQRKALVEIYRGFLDANTVRRARGSHKGR